MQSSGVDLLTDGFKIELCHDLSLGGLREDGPFFFIPVTWWKSRGIKTSEAVFNAGFIYHKHYIVIRVVWRLLSSKKAFL